MSEGQIAYPYLAFAIDRVSFALQQVSAGWQPRPRVLLEIDTAVPPPVWWVYPGAVTKQEIASNTTQWTFTANMRLVIGYATEGYDASLVSKLWQWMPEVLNFFDVRRSLIITPGESVPRYLVPGSAILQAPTAFGVSPGGSHVGVTFPLDMTFTISQYSLFGN